MEPCFRAGQILERMFFLVKGGFAEGLIGDRAEEGLQPQQRRQALVSIIELFPSTVMG